MSNNPELLYPSISILSFSLSWLIVRYSWKPSSLLFLLDQPNERSLHHHPTPRLGGIGIVISFLTTWLLILLLMNSFPQGMREILLGLVLIATVSFYDDRKHVLPQIRLLIQFIVSALVIYGGFSITQSMIPYLDNFGTKSILWIMTALFIVWMINLYNFMDGMDGFAGGMSVFGFFFLSLPAVFHNQVLYACLSLAISAASLGFLLHNFPPARIFMGDIGSASIGFLVAVFSLWGVKDGIFPLWFPLLVFSPFIVDATVTLLRRIARKEKVWIAHRSHYYQRLVQLGWGHKRTVLWEYGLMITCASSAVLILDLSQGIQVMVLTLWLVIYFVMAISVSLLEKRVASTSI
ncbi:MAG: glycosyltransferase family 4 protein [Gammaproteobacteria bacterium]|nr:MAG: glycosyltransferase family 4 protein [Gammaproteobacteria bacterium]